MRVVRNEWNSALFILTVIWVFWAVMLSGKLHSWCSGKHHMLAFFFVFFSCTSALVLLQTGYCFAGIFDVTCYSCCYAGGWNRWVSLGDLIWFISNGQIFRAHAQKWQMLISGSSSVKSTSSRFSGKHLSLESFWIWQPGCSRLKVVKWSTVPNFFVFSGLTPEDHSSAAQPLGHSARESICSTDSLRACFCCYLKLFRVAGVKWNWFFLFSSLLSVLKSRTENKLMVFGIMKQFRSSSKSAEFVNRLQRYSNISV